MARMQEPLQGVDRVAQIVRILADAPEGLRLVDLVDRTGLNKTTVHRLLASLTDLRWVEQDEPTGRYAIGLELVAIGLAGSNRHSLIKAANRHLVRLAELTGDTVYLQVPYGLEALCVDSLAGSFPIRVLTLGLGDRRPLGVGAGSMALLAWTPEPEREEAIAATVLGPFPEYRDAAVLSAKVQETRARGYAHLPAHSTPDAEAVGVPVLGPDGRAVAALSVAAISSRFADGRLAQVAGRIREEAAQLAERLSGLPTERRESEVQTLADRVI